MSQDISEIICAKLNITIEQVISLYASDPFHGFSGHQVGNEINERFTLRPNEPMGYQLADLGVLTDAEGRWLDDVEEDED